MALEASFALNFVHPVEGEVLDDVSKPQVDNRRVQLLSLVISLLTPKGNLARELVVV